MYKIPPWGGGGSIASSRPNSAIASDSAVTEIEIMDEDSLILLGLGAPNFCCAI